MQATLFSRWLQARHIAIVVEEYSNLAHSTHNYYVKCFNLTYTFENTGIIFNFYMHL